MSGSGRPVSSSNAASSGAEDSNRPATSRRNSSMSSANSATPRASPRTSQLLGRFLKHSSSNASSNTSPKNTAYLQKVIDEAKSRAAKSTSSSKKREEVQGNILYRTKSPLFAIRSDEDLDASLEAAMSMGKGESGNGMELTSYDALPPKWKEFVDNDVLCDVNLRARDGKIFRAHRVILCAAAPNFYAQCCRQAQEVNNAALASQMLSVNLDSPSLAAILDFVYSGDFPKSLEKVAHLLPIAQRYKLLPLLQQACAFLLQNMRADNALQIYAIGHAYFCPKLKSQAKSFILNNFRNVIRSPDFLSLESSQLKAILRDDHLNARNEAMVFEAIRVWVEHAPVKRRRSIPDLLTTVRFGLMSYGYFTNVVYQWHFVNEDEAVRRALEAPSLLLTSIDSLNNTDVDLNDPLARPRVPYEIIFAVGGWSAGAPTAFIETYDIRADRWFLLNTDSTPRAYHGLVALGQYIYMIGGFDGTDHFSTVKRYDPQNHIWEEKSCMLFQRCYVSCCELEGIIYACGGYNGRLRMSSAEKYTPELNQWELISPMNRQRSDASAAALKGKVFIAGGFTGAEVLNSVESYDPKENQWTFIQPMNTARSGVSLVAYRDSLYAVGGFNGFSRLNTAERLNPDEGPWGLIPDMSSARSNFAAVAADELLICIGGFNGATTIPYVECYDSKVNEWFDASHMNLNRSALSACVVNNLPNAREYSYVHRIGELLGISLSENESDNV